MTDLTRQQEIQRIWRDYQGLYVISGVLIGLLLFPFLELIINDLSELLIGIVPEAIGIVFTVVIINQLNQQREVQRKITERKEWLVRDVGSTVKDIAIKAIDELRVYGLLTGNNGILQKAVLRYANLSEADLMATNLSEANLGNAKLSEAKLSYANLKGANLNSANLEGAKLWSANLSSATLINANLSGANLVYANLSGAFLQGANLDNVTWEIETSGRTSAATLPDGTTWSPNTDMGCFTDGKHPDYLTTSEKIDTIREEMGLDSIYRDGS